MPFKRMVKEAAAALFQAARRARESRTASTVAPVLLRNLPSGSSAGSTVRL